MTFSLAMGQWPRRLQQVAAWPRLPRYGLMLILFLLPLVIGWIACLAPGIATLKHAQQEEQQHKSRYQQKLQQASALPQFQTRQQQLIARIEQSQQQLLDASDLHLILAELASIAARHHLRLEDARPAPHLTQQSLLVLPLQLRLLGRYHALAQFAAALAASARPLLLSDLQINPASADSDMLRMEATVFIHRQTAIVQQL